MPVLYDLPHWKNANSLRDCHRNAACHVGFEELGTPGFARYGNWGLVHLLHTSQRWEFGMKQAVVALSSSHAPLPPSHPSQLFHTKDVAKRFNIWNMRGTHQIPTAAKYKLWLPWLSHSKARHFLLCGLELIAKNNFQHFSPCYMDWTNFKNQMVFLPFITDNQLFCEFNFFQERTEILIRITIWVWLVLEQTCQKHQDPGFLLSCFLFFFFFLWETRERLNIVCLHQNSWEMWLNIYKK